MTTRYDPQSADHYGNENSHRQWAFIYAFKWGRMLKVGQSIDPQTHYANFQSVHIEQFHIFEPPADVNGYTAERLVQYMPALAPYVFASSGYRGRRTREWFKDVSSDRVIAALGVAESLLGGKVFQLPGKLPVRQRRTPYPDFMEKSPLAYKDPADYFSKRDGMLIVARDACDQVLVACAAPNKEGRHYRHLLRAPSLSRFQMAPLQQVLHFPSLGAATACADCCQALLARRGLVLEDNRRARELMNLRAFVLRSGSLRQLDEELERTAAMLGGERTDRAAD